MGESSGLAEDDAGLVAGLYPGLRRFAGVVRPFDMDVDDLVQEALVSVLRSRRLGDLENPGAYLRATIVNVAGMTRRWRVRERRAYRRWGSSQVTDATVSYPSDVADLMRLSRTDRAVLFLHDIEGFDFGAVAEMLDSTESAVRMRASRSGCGVC